jgi:hypothetical protein
MAVACHVTNGIDTKAGAPIRHSGLLERIWLATLATFLPRVAFLVIHQLLAGSGLREAALVRTLTVY